MPQDISKLLTGTGIDSADVTDTFQAINADGLPFPCYEVRITNGSTVPVQISIDGTSVNDFLAIGETRYLVAQQASAPNNQKANWPKGMIFYASGPAGTGTVYVFGSYQPN